MNAARSINSQAYWNRRFSVDWEANNGREQSRFFCQLAGEHLPDWLLHTIRQQHLSLCDWGCAEGDGTDMLAQIWGITSITGVDFSETAIEKAKNYYPRLHFLAENFLENNSNTAFDVLFSSNTLEHFAAPWDIFARLSQRARQFMILLVPYREFIRHEEHETSFVARNIPLSPCEDWVLAYSRVIETGQLQPSYWPGEQILLVFARTWVLSQLRLTLDSAYLNVERWLAKVAELEDRYSATTREFNVVQSAQYSALSERDTALSERDTALSERDTALSERDTALSERDTALSERDAALSERDAALSERDAALSERDAALSERQTLETERDWYRHLFTDMSVSRVWRATKPLRLFFHQLRLVRRQLSGLSLPIWRLHGLTKHLHRHQAEACQEMASTPALGKPVFAALDLSTLQESQTPCILMLVEQFYDGGLERVVIDLCCELRHQGVAVEIAVAGAGGRCSAESVALGIPVMEFGHDQSSFVAYLQRRCPALLLSHHSYFAFPHIAASGVPIIEVLHNTYFWQQADMELSVLRERYVTYYVAVSEHVRDFSIAHLAIPASKLHLIHNGLSPIGLVRPPMQRVMAQRLKTIAHPIVVHVANWHAQKNHRIVVAAFRLIQQQYPQAQLQLLGAHDIDPALQEAVYRDIAYFELEKSVRITGVVNRRQLSHVLTKAHVALLPSAFEGFSIASLEYAYFGLPSVLSHTGAGAYLLGLFGHGILVRHCVVPPEHLAGRTVEESLAGKLDDAVQEVAHAVTEILQKYADYCQHGFEAASRYPEYSGESVARHYLALCRDYAGLPEGGTVPHVETMPCSPMS